MATGSATIHDVAAAAGVSAATVSRFLHGQKVRSADSIRAAIESLEFRPRPAARSLKSGITRSVAVVVPDITNIFFAAAVKGMESISSEGGYTIVLHNTEEDPEREARVLLGLYGRVDGIIITPADESHEAQARLATTGVPIVLMDREIGDGGAFDSVLVDNVAGAAQAATLLTDLGHSRIAIVSGPLDTTPGRTRHDGFLGALHAAGVEPEPALVQISDFREDGGYQAALRLLALKTPPTAIFAANNLMCIGILRALHDMRVRVPDEVSVIGFDDLQLAELLSPALTVIGRPTVEQGALAMRLLLNRLDGRAVKPQRIVLDTSLILRDSCSPPAAVPTPKRLTRSGGTNHD